MRVLFLVSTVNSNFDSSISNLPAEHCIVINQGTNKYIKNDFKQLIHLDYFGLSKSRNAGFDLIEDLNDSYDMVLICDDDVIYKENILDKFKKLSTNEIHICRIETHNKKLFKSYNDPAELSIFNLFSVSSVEMLLPYSVIEKQRFNENFGLGSRYRFGGEEFLFLRESLDSGIKIRSNNIVIGSHPELSTGSNVALTDYWVSKGALFREGFRFGFFYMFIFFIKKYVSNKDIMFYRSFTAMMKGYFNYYE